MSERLSTSEAAVSFEGAVCVLREQFVQRTDCYPVQLRDGSYVTVHEPITHTLLAKHLRGEITLGTYLLAPDSTGRFLVLDADTAETWENLQQLSAELFAARIPNYLEVSRRGGHLWLFLDRPRSGADIRACAHGVLQEFSVRDVEVYPKQDVLGEGPGSLIRMPFGVHRLTGKRYGFFTPLGVPLASSIRAQAQRLKTPQTVSTAAFDHYRLSVRNEEQQPILPTLTSVEGLVSERIKRAISVYAFVGQFVPLTATGRGLCPFHDDTVKSLSVNRDKNYWHCFAGCGGGSIIDFWMRWRDCDFQTALRELAEQLL